MAIKIGDKAPIFGLADTDKKERSLTEFLGKKTVLAFYPGAFTGACTSEMCALRDSLAELQNLNAQVVGISVDSPFANKAFAEHNKLGFPLLSDHTRAVSNMYAGVYDGFGGLKGYTASKRAVYVLDASGMVKYIWSTDAPATEPPYEEIKKSLAAI